VPTITPVTTPRNFLAKLECFEEALALPVLAGSSELAMDWLIDDKISDAANTK
jgi:hypothetical protein